MLCPEDGKECWSSGCFFQHGLNKVCSKRNLTVATGGTVIMKEQDAAHSFTEWTYEKDIHGTAYAFYRRNDFEFKAAITNPESLADQLNELTRLRSELQQAKEENEELKQRLDKDFDLIDLRDQLAKQKEINAELVSYLERVMSRPIFKEHFDTRQTKFLIQKSKS